MIKNDCQNMSFYQQDQSFCCVVDPNSIDIPLNIGQMTKKIDNQNNNKNKKQDDELRQSVQFISQQKMNTVQTPDSEFKQTANFFFPSFQSSNDILNNNNNNVDDQFQNQNKKKKDEFLINQIHLQHNNNNNINNVHSLSGQECEKQRKIFRKSRVQQNNLLNQIQYNQNISQPLIRKSMKSMSQPKLYTGVNEQGNNIVQNGIYQPNENGLKNIDNNFINEFIKNENTNNNNNNKMIKQQILERKQIPNRQIINPQQSEYQGDQYLMNNQSIQQQSLTPLKFQQSLIQANQINDQQKKDLHMNNFLQFCIEKQANSVKNNQLQQIQIQPKSTQNISSQSSNKILPLNNQFYSKSRKQSSIGISFKPNLQLPDDIFGNDNKLQQQTIKDLVPQSCQSQLGQQNNDNNNIHKGYVGQSLSSLKGIIKQNNNNNISSLKQNNLINGDNIQYQGYQNNITEKNNNNTLKPLIQNQKLEKLELHQSMSRNNKEQLDPSLTFNQQDMIQFSHQQIPNTQQNNYRKASFTYIDEIQKNLNDDGLMQSLKNQEIQLNKIRQQQIKNFQGLYSNQNMNKDTQNNNINNMLENNNINNNNLKGQFIQMRQDINGQLLFSSQQDSRRNLSHNHSTSLLSQFNNSNNRSIQTMSKDKRPINTQILKQQQQQLLLQQNQEINSRLIQLQKRNLQKYYQQDQVDESNQNTSIFNHLNAQVIQFTDQDVTSDDNINIDNNNNNQEQNVIQMKKLAHRRSVASMHNNNNPSNLLYQNNNNNNVNNRTNSIKEQQKEGTDIERRRKQIKQLPLNNKNIQEHQKQQPDLPLLINNNNNNSNHNKINNSNNNNSQGMTQLSQNQQKRIDVKGIQKYPQQKKQYQFLSLINDDVFLQKIQPNIQQQSQQQQLFQGDDLIPTHRESVTADTNYSQSTKNPSGKTFLQRKPQENILNKIFHNVCENVLD